MNHVSIATYVASYADLPSVESHRRSAVKCEKDSNHREVYEVFHPVHN
jgi:hypothetical protein